MVRSESPISIFFFHDYKVLGDSFKEVFDESGYQVLALQKPTDCLEAARTRAGSCDVMMVHKDLGIHVRLEAQTNIDCEKVVTEMHANNPYARIGIISGEYPAGLMHVLQLGADFYCAPDEVGSAWAIQQFKKRWVTEKEIAQRGKEVARPPNSVSY